jgi:phage I-like protein
VRKDSEADRTIDKLLGLHGQFAAALSHPRPATDFALCARLLALHNRIALRSISGHSVALPQDGSAPEWIEILPLGTFTTSDGRGPFQADGPAIIAATKAHGLDKFLPIDYDHGTYTRDDSRAAGWIHALKIAGPKLLARVEWTQKGAAAIAAKEYRFVSPVYEFDPDDPKAPPEKASGRITYLTGAGLVNDPALSMTPLAA